MSQKDRFKWRTVFLHAHEHYIKTKRYSRHYRKNIAKQFSTTEFVKKHKDHTCHNERKCHELFHSRALFQENGTDKDSKHRSAILKQNRVGRGGSLIGRDKQKHGRGTGYRRGNLRK